MTRQSTARRRMRDGSRLREIVAGRNTRNGYNRPRSTYEAVTRQMVKSLTAEMREVKGRVNQLIFLLIGAIVLEVLMRLIGVGP